MNQPTTILELYKKPQSWLITIIIAASIFYGLYLTMARLTGYENETCTIGAGLNIQNILFSSLISVFTGMMALGFLELFRRNNFSRSNLLTGSSLSVGGVLGALTVFCTLCTIPVISVFGMAISLSFFTTYNTLFKLLSLLFFVIGLGMLDKQLLKDCQRCKT
jgi:uncharacterized membrane protein YdcZ (DUF606 family)